MAFTKAEVDTLYERILGFEDQVKELNALKKEAFELFAEQKDVEKKSLRKGYAAYKELLKNKEEFELIDPEVRQIVDFLTDDTVVTTEEE